MCFLLALRVTGTYLLLQHNPKLPYLSTQRFFMDLSEFSAAYTSYFKKYITRRPHAQPPNSIVLRKLQPPHESSSAGHWTEDEDNSSLWATFQKSWQELLKFTLSVSPENLWIVRTDAQHTMTYFLNGCHPCKQSMCMLTCDASAKLNHVWKTVKRKVSVIRT